jgi:tetrapyrrole methylase family protein/MazG family protein
MKAFDELVGIFEKLHSVRGCKWDRIQTHNSLIKCLKEETREFVRAVRTKNPENIKEELGDILLQVMFHSQIAKKRGEFTINDVIETLNAKLRHRHPHVFDKKRVNSVREIVNNWNKIKKKEKCKK